jgi:hypothetical protein
MSSIQAGHPTTITSGGGIRTGLAKLQPLDGEKLPQFMQQHQMPELIISRCIIVGVRGLLASVVCL